MPEQKTSDEAAETGIKMLGVALMVSGLNQLSADPLLGVAGLAAGLVAFGVGVRYRNIQTDITAEEVMEQIDNATNALEEAIEKYTKED